MNRNTDDLYNKMANLCTRYNYFFEKYVEYGKQADLLLSYKLYGALEACAILHDLELDYKRVNGRSVDIAYSAKDKEYIVFVSNKPFKRVQRNDIEAELLLILADAPVMIMIKKTREQVLADIDSLVGVDVKRLDSLKDYKAELVRYYSPLFKKLETKQKKVMSSKLRGKKQTETAKALGVSKQYVSALYNKAIDRVFEMCNF